MSDHSHSMAHGQGCLVPDSRGRMLVLVAGPQSAALSREATRRVGSQSILPGGCAGSHDRGAGRTNRVETPDGTVGRGHGAQGRVADRMGNEGAIRWLTSKS